jgi:hypothetical protein
MALTQEMFRFVTMRRTERLIMSRIASRLIRDRRQATRSSMLVKLFGAGSYETKLVTANTFAASTDFLAADDPAILALEPMIAFFRERLEPEIDLTHLVTEFQGTCPMLAGLLQQVPPGQLLESTNAMTASLWDSLYVETIRGCDRYVSTNYLVDGLRMYHVLRLLWLSAKLKLTTWAGVGFDGYDTLIDLNAARAVDSDNGIGISIGSEIDTPVDLDPQAIPPEIGALQTLTEQLERIDYAGHQISSFLKADAVRTVSQDARRETFFNADAAHVLAKQPALSRLNLGTTPVDEVQRMLRLDRDLATLQRQQIVASLVNPGAGREYRELTRQRLAARAVGEIPAASLDSLSAPGGVFRVPLAVGAMKPPAVGDLLIVGQELRRYELGELAEIESIMRGERRERTIRKLARTSQTTTTESSFEQEESSSSKTDERFRLSSEAQQAAEQSFGVEAGVSVSGKYGPVQVSASVNASFDTSESSSESTSQEYAKTVTEEASKRVKSSIKESTSITILTETQDTSLHGFNNEKGTTHINGLYRWVDKIYDAQLLNYGRRMSLPLNVPEPAGFYRALILQNEAAAMAALVEPLHPSRIGRGIVTPLPESNTTGGFLSYQDINEGNYAALAAFYDVSVQPPPPEYLTISKAFVYPDASAATEITPHDQVHDLSYVASDNTLTLGPNYALTQVSVFAPVGSTGEFGSYVNALKLGEVAPPATKTDGTTIAEANLILVQVADKSFYMSVRRDPGDPNKKIISTNFNTWMLIEEDWWAFGEVVQPAIPITITANFEGIFTFTVICNAYRLLEAYDAWKSGTFAAIIKGYNAKKQAYDQAVTLAQSKAQSSTEAKTFQLRDDQYRSIELTELKRGCIDLLTEGTATGYTSIAVAEDGTPDIVYDPAQGTLLPGNWRSPLANGSVAEFFELAFEWENTIYAFLPYYWAGAERWKDLAQASGADPVFEQFLRAGNASVVVPVRPGYERPVIFFLKTGLIWGGSYLSLFTSQDMLAVYADVELGRQFDPPLEIGDPWEIRLPTSMVMLQEDGTLPEFPPEDAVKTTPPAEEPVPDESVPF